MFLISIEYKVPFEEVEPHLASHIQFVKRYYDDRKFLLTGKKVPRTGGIILADVENHDVLMGILEEDPFLEYELADFDVTEIQVSQVSQLLIKS
ncbi:YciI family protein [Mangrovibacterium lignilyticum]|uniref:YciI family protein n=1 Tax=Mangrovibacterium lignilyticum TaxID=2668052 RepID=UPI0013D05F10|nr:YciI family protein [Mangrovibacterium lignilyticum]